MPTDAEPSSWQTTLRVLRDTEGPVMHVVLTDTGGVVFRPPDDSEKGLFMVVPELVPRF